MPTTKSAAKRLRSTPKRQLRNQIRESIVRTTEKHFLEKIEANDGEGAKKARVECFSALDKAAKLGTIHDNRANRKKSRLQARLTAILPKR